jgi:predicted alpha/beta hydrolase
MQSGLIRRAAFGRPGGGPQFKSGTRAARAGRAVPAPRVYATCAVACTRGVWFDQAGGLGAARRPPAGQAHDARGARRRAMGSITVAARDGVPLAAQVFGDAATARGAVLVASAMGVEQGYYAPFAQWLAERGFVVATFDFRGIGESRRGPLRSLEADVFTWAQQDAASVLDWLGAQVPGRPLGWVGHSLGGQIVGLLPNAAKVRAVVTVATGTGYWRDYVPRLRRLALALWYGIVPAGLALCGYFPGRRLGIIGDVPAGVMRQWRRWCLNPEYLFGVEAVQWRAAYARITAPMLSLSFTDDEYMSARNVESFHAFYAGAARTARRLAPADAGSGRVGHFGFFRRRHGEALWPLAGDWLAAQLG